MSKEEPARVPHTLTDGRTVDVLVVIKGKHLRKIDTFAGPNPGKWGSIMAQIATTCTIAGNPITFEELAEWDLDDVAGCAMAQQNAKEALGKAKSAGASASDTSPSSGSTEA